MPAVDAAAAEVVAQVEVVEAGAVALLQRPTVRAELLRFPQYLHRKEQMQPMLTRMPRPRRMRQALVERPADVEPRAVGAVVEDEVVPLLLVELLLPQLRP